MKKLTLSILAILFVFSLSLVSCGGQEKVKEDTNANTEENVAGDENTTSENVTATDYSAGKEIYEKSCQVCHQANGEGTEAFPALKDKGSNLKTIVGGVEGTAMVSFKDQLSNQQIADVANDINHSWGNNFADVTVDDVAAAK